MAEFQYESWKGRQGPFTAEQAVEYQAARGDAMIYDGFGILEARVNGLIEIVGRLLDTMPPEQVVRALGPEWSVVDDKAKTR